jgi:hypothetical protein
MPINATIANTFATPKALFKILLLEGSQHALPVSAQLAGASVAVYAIAEAALHALDHALVPSLFFGVGAAALVSVATFAVSRLYQASRKFEQTLTAIAATGAMIATASIILHFVFAVALPPPLPTDRLVRFLLFPIALWQVFMFAFIYRHASMRMIPAFALAATLVIIINFIMATLIK